MAKRALDIVLSCMGMLVLSPLLAAIALTVRVKLGSPVLFKQIRPGKGGEPFRIWKFRTMTDLRNSQGDLLADKERMSDFGYFLRSSSLDELPELINVLMGDMSIVGPRPLLMQYLERYTPEQARRHQVRPGITGLAQVNGRNLLSWEEKFRLDVWYVDHWSLWLDIKIILMTIRKVFLREGISAAGEATMPEFNPKVTRIDAD